MKGDIRFTESIPDKTYRLDVIYDARPAPATPGHRIRPRKGSVRPPAENHFGEGR